MKANWGKDSLVVKIVRAVLRVVTALLIAAIFLILLSVAAAQQEAMVQLKAKKSDYSYSVARSLLNEADRERENLAHAQAANARLRLEAQQLERQKRARGNAYESSLKEVDQIARLIVRSGACETLKATADLPSVPDLKLWDNVQECAQTSAIRKDLAERIQALKLPDADPTALARAIANLDQDATATRSEIDTNKLSIDESRKAIAGAGLVSEALQDIRIIDRVPIMGWLQVTSFPPPLMQILLSFFSGLFGALLLTLILAVYPHNDLNLVGSDSYWNRILLGGLIAVGVYVVIGGGVAVIGSTRALTSENANFMSFCAIGILSGMFSERVARSLSDRAQMLLNVPRSARAASKKPPPKKTKRPERTPAPTPTPTPPPAPPQG